jgi:biotin carboxyl carrier protein
MVERPLFRTDLVSQPIDEQGQRFIDVTDPDNGTTFRFYEVEYAVACAMDGNRDLVGLIHWARAELGLEPSQAELQTVITTLDDLGYLAGDYAYEISGDEVASTFGDDLSLGSPGRSPLDGGRRPRSDSGAQFDLGAAGRSGLEPAGSRRSTESEDRHVELGAPGKADSSLLGAAHGRPSRPAMQSGFGEDEGEPDITRADSRRTTEVDDSTYEMEADEPDELAGGNGAGAAQRMGAPVPSLAKPTTAGAGVAQSGRFSDDVSVDLSQHLDIDADDVKEAVRQSKVMAVPALPEDLEEEDAPLPPQTRTPAPAPPMHYGPGASSGFSASEPLTLPSDTGAMSRSRSATETQELAGGTTVRSSSTAWIFVLVLLLLLGGGVAVAWYMNRIPWFPRSETSSSSVPAPSNRSAEPNGVPAKTAAKSEAPKPAAAEAAVPEAKLEGASNTEHLIAAPRAGTVVWLPPAGAAVAQGDILVKFDGVLEAERILKEENESKARYQAKLDKATADGNKKEMQRFEAEVARKQRDIANAQAKLGEMVITAPVSGTVELKVEPGAVVKPQQPILRLTTASGPHASFQVEKPERYAPGKEVRLVPKADQGMAVQCKVTAVEGKRVDVACPEDSGMSAGTIVRLQ